jgi:hypothetical protein
VPEGLGESTLSFYSFLLFRGCGKMGKFLELDTSEAKYINDMSGMCHFGIDCACGGKDGGYSGSHYLDAGIWIG